MERRYIVVFCAVVALAGAFFLLGLFSSYQAAMTVSAQ
jgi:hypothetical protein